MITRVHAEHYRQTQVETTVMEADPHRLVSMLLSGACDRIRLAEACLERNDQARKGKAIGEACAIVGHLNGSLDHEAGGEVAANLSRSVGAPVKLLGQVPLEQAVREHGDEGTPIVLAEPDSPSGRAYREIADGLAVRPRGLAGMNLGIDTTRHL